MIYGRAWIQTYSKIQKTFVRLAARWPHGIPPYGPSPIWRKRKKKSSTTKVKVEVIDAVNGFKTSGKSADESTAKLRKWLKLRNVRAEFTDVILKKKSPWLKLDDTDFIDYPIIVKVGTYRAPYLIKRIQDRKTRKGITTVSIQLETVENLNYLAILSKKKEQLANLKKGSK